VKPQCSRRDCTGAEYRRLTTSLDLLTILLLMQSGIWLYLIYICSRRLSVATVNLRALQSISVFPLSD